MFEEMGRKLEKVLRLRDLLAREGAWEREERRIKKPNSLNCKNPSRRLEDECLLQHGANSLESVCRVAERRKEKGRPRTCKERAIGFS